MKVIGLKSSRVYSIRIKDYLIDWRREVSRPQALVKQFLYPLWKNEIVAEELPLPGCGGRRSLRIDLVNITKRIAIEVSPSSSHSYSPFFHKNRIGFGNAVRRELDKQEWCRINNFQYIELTDDDLNNLSRKLFADRGIDL